MQWFLYVDHSKVFNASQMTLNLKIPSTVFFYEKRKKTREIFVFLNRGIPCRSSQSSECPSLCR